MSEQTANPESTTTDTGGAGAADASSEIEKLDESLSDMTSALLGEAGDEDIDFDGMFAEIEPGARTEPKGRSEPDAAGNEPGASDEAGPAESDEISVSEQLDEIEAAVAAAIEDADAGLDDGGAGGSRAPEPESAERDDGAETEVPDRSAPTGEPEPAAEAEAEPETSQGSTPTDSEPTDAADAGADPDDTMAAVSQDLENSAEAPPASAEEDSVVSPPESVSADTAAAELETASVAPDPGPAEAPHTQREAQRDGLPSEHTSDGEAAESLPDGVENEPVHAGAEPLEPRDPAERATARKEPKQAPDQGKLSAGIALALGRMGPVAASVAKPILHKMGGHVAKGAEAVAGSFTGQPKLIRHSVAWIALWTLFNAGVVWAYLGLFRSGSPTPVEGSGTQITGAAAAPESLIGAGGTAVSGSPTGLPGR